MILKVERYIWHFLRRTEYKMNYSWYYYHYNIFVSHCCLRLENLLRNAKVQFYFSVTTTFAARRLFGPVHLKIRNRFCTSKKLIFLFSRKIPSCKFSISSRLIFKVNVMVCGNINTLHKMSKNISVSNFNSIKRVIWRNNI